MRQLNIAQRSANFVASVRDCASVVGNKVRLFLSHHLPVQFGTSSMSQGYEHPEIYSFGMRRINMWPAMTPATCPLPSKPTSKRGS
jgi:hypothetical protein